VKVPYFDLPAQIRSVRPELDQAIARTLDSCAFALGPEVVRFEGDFAKFIGSRFCIGFNSGTSALHVAMRLLDIGPGDEVITTPFTFIATSWAIAYVGAKPVYVDIDKRTMNMDPALLERAITPRTKAIMPVHLYGHPFDLDPILEISKRRGIPLVEDAAQAHGARYKGRPVGTFGEISGFSFYPGKNLGACGEAGALMTDRPDYAKRAGTLREHGSSTRYFHEEVGYNYRMEGIQGAVLGVKLAHLPAWTAARRRTAHRYHELLRATPLVLPVEEPWAESVYHLYVVRHPSRDRLREHLEKNGVGSALHYPLPLHLQTCFSSLGYGKGDFPVAERAAQNCLSLPVYPEMTDAQVDYVAGVINAFTGW
jgi:dTDP-4-amino-4,6-dideoxygalactose transaminase